MVSNDFLIRGAGELKRTLKMGLLRARWCFDCSRWDPTESEILLATSRVQPEEKDRLGRFVFADDFKPSLIGRLMMRKFVSESIRVAYDKVRFGRDDKGKPVLVDSENKYGNLGFNVSHQGDYVVFTGERDVPCLGVDVMKLEYSGGKSLDEFFRIMNRQFSVYEWAKIRDFRTEKEQLSMFCRHWSLKESYVKALGVGITISLQDISFRVCTNELSKDYVTADTELHVKNKKEDWLFHEMLLDDNHCVSVAVNEKVLPKGFDFKPILFQEITFTELTENSIPLLETDYEYTKRFFSKPYKKVTSVNIR